MLKIEIHRSLSPDVMSHSQPTNFHLKLDLNEKYGEEMATLSEIVEMIYLERLRHPTSLSHIYK